MYLFTFRERRREREREEEKHQCVIASLVPPTGDLACSLGMYPDWESNQQHFGLQASAQSTDPHQSLLCLRFKVAAKHLFKVIKWFCILAIMVWGFKFLIFTLIFGMVSYINFSHFSRCVAPKVCFSLHFPKD